MEGWVLPGRKSANDDRNPKIWMTLLVNADRVDYKNYGYYFINPSKLNFEGFYIEAGYSRLFTSHILDENLNDKHFKQSVKRYY
jgi:hypothetical protein